MSVELKPCSKNEKCEDIMEFLVQHGAAVTLAEMHRAKFDWVQFRFCPYCGKPWNTRKESTNEPS